MAITALKLLSDAAKRGWSFKVDQGDDDGPVGPIYSAWTAWERVKEVDEAWVEFFDMKGESLGAARLMAPSKITCSPEESLVDYTVSRDKANKGALETLCDTLIEGAE